VPDWQPPGVPGSATVSYDDDARGDRHPGCPCRRSEPSPWPRSDEQHGRCDLCFLKAGKNALPFRLGGQSSATRVSNDLDPEPLSATQPPGVSLLVARLPRQRVCTRSAMSLPSTRRWHSSSTMLSRPCGRRTAPCSSTSCLSADVPAPSGQVIAHRHVMPECLTPNPASTRPGVQPMVHRRPEAVVEAGRGIAGFVQPVTGHLGRSGRGDVARLPASGGVIRA
jgi:hypothetical protein